MSLNFDLSKIKKSVRNVPKDHPGLKYVPGYMIFNDGSMRHPMTESFIWLTMSIWMGTWTEDNIQEVYFRAKVIEGLQAELLVVDGENIMQGFAIDWDDEKKTWTKRVLVPKDIYSHIGMNTNVSNDPDTAAWMDHVINTVYRRDCERAYNEGTPKKRVKKNA
jgi:hypothetical protein